jgi:hypothetical protein
MNETNSNHPSAPNDSFQTDSLACGDLLTERVEPWEEPVDGQQLLDELATVMSRFVVLPKHAAETLALWIVTHTRSNGGR